MRATRLALVLLLAAVLVASASVALMVGNSPYAHIGRPQPERRRRTVEGETARIPQRYWTTWGSRWRSV